MAIIAISRQMGSGGYTIAAGVAKALNYDYVDRQMVVNAAKAYDVRAAELARVADQHLAGWQAFNEEKLRYRTFLDAAYYKFAEKDNVVTAGRGIVTLVHGIGHALRIRIIAPFEVRVARTMKKENLDHAKATRRVHAYDEDVTARIAYLFGPAWMIPENYDLVINTAYDDPALYIDMAVSVASHPRFRATPESTQAIKNRSLAAQVRAAIAQDDLTRSTHLEATADKGHVTLKGPVWNAGIRDTVLSVARKVPGVVSVSGEEVAISRFHSLLG
jgi:cytidylate kinase